MTHFKKDYNSYFLSVTQLLCALATLSMILGFVIGTESGALGIIFLICAGLLVLAYFIMSCISINKTS